MDDLVKFNRERRQLRRLFMKEYSNLEDVTKKDLPKEEWIVAIKASYFSMEATYENLFAIDEKIKDLMLGGTNTDAELDAEFDSRLDFRDKWFATKARYANMVNNSPCFEGEFNSSNYQKHIRLPKLELKKFDGELKNWIGFWSQFSKIHNDTNLRDEDKFDYLLQSMTPGSSAQKLIEGFPLSKENYFKAIELLKSRYGKDELLIEYYVRELLTLVLSKTNRLSVTHLYDKLEVQLRALESLGVTKEKYAAMLFPLVETSIPEHIFKIWERYRVNKNVSTIEPDSCLKELLLFLKTEVEAEERLRLREGCFGVSSDGNVKLREDSPELKRPNKPKTPSAAVLVASDGNRDPKMCTDMSLNKNLCAFCGKTTHISSDCFSIFDKTVSERTEIAKKKGLCLKCLKKGHMAHKCRIQVKCHICMGKHLAILCQKVPTNNVSTPGGEDKPKQTPVQSTSSFSTLNNGSKTTYLQTLNAFIDCNGELKKVRILCDSGSQKSFISSHCVSKLGLSSNGKVLIQQEVFGGMKTGPKCHNTYDLTLSSLDKDFRTNVKVVEQLVICNYVPKFCDYSLITRLEKENIFLTDVSSCDGDNFTGIDVLLGADTWTQIFTPEFHKVNDQLIALKTRLGWTIVGTSDKDSSFVSSMFVAFQSPQDIRQFWELEALGITDPSAKQQREERDRDVLAFFEETVYRDVDGRYVVKLPWIADHPPLDTNREVAKRRLLSTTRKLNQSNMFLDYDLVLKDWLNNGIIERVADVDISQSLKCHYLPHRAVVKEGSTTRIRPVFDASAKDINGYSVNGCLESGPNLIELIPKVLTNFRLHAFALTADIEKAFLQIGINHEDRDMLRFLWWEENQVIIYRHARVVFGLSCSPFLLGAVLNNLLENAPTRFKHVAEALQKTFYVDNCLTGVNNVLEQDSFINDAQTLLKLGGFNLRGWAGNGYHKTPDQVENVLGLKWLCSKDELYCNVQPLNIKGSVLTRRTLLSCAQKVFDPIGFTAPVGLIPKNILQMTWTLKVGWDDELPQDLQVQFQKWVDELGFLEKCAISRRVFLNETSTVHVFSDASKIAFGCCVFLRTEVDGIVHVSLILAKSRVAPIKPISLPRLELMGAITGVRLSSLALQCLNNPNVPVFYWLDSTVVLAWIAKQGKWSVFVENRVKEIRGFTQLSQWRHVPGPDNPADILSRGCTPKKLLNSQWWLGPRWLYESSNEWPSDRPSPDPDELRKEVRKTVITASTVETESITQMLGTRFSTYSKIVRTVAWMLRLSPRNKVINREIDISSEEFVRAEKVVFKLIQRDSFPEGLKSNGLSGVQKFCDEDGVIRLRTRVSNQEDSAEYQYPVILPSAHPVVEKMIRQHHLQNKHAGVQALLVILREKVWILKGRRTLQRVVHDCVRCKRHSTKALEMPSPPLPTDRTQISSCFQVGVDLAGPLITRDGKKCWVVIFTCAVYRAVHLELIQSLETEAFIRALR